MVVSTLQSGLRPSFTQRLYLVCVNFIRGCGESARFMRNFSWQIHFFWVFVRNLLRESCQRNIFSYFVFWSWDLKSDHAYLLDYGDYVHIYTADLNFACYSRSASFFAGKTWLVKLKLEKNISEYGMFLQKSLYIHIYIHNWPLQPFSQD